MTVHYIRKSNKNSHVTIVTYRPISCINEWYYKYRTEHTTITYDTYSFLFNMYSVFTLYMIFIHTFLCENCIISCQQREHEYDNVKYK